jgi:WD40 repeat protein
VLHRDLKPSNIMLDREGHVRITDFGLARRTTSNNELTATGQILGTPSYMSPEQAAGDPSQIDSRSDIYSLGAVLYALLTHRPPHEGPSLTATLMAVAHSPPRRPREINLDIDPALERICLKCLEKSPGARYPTAATLAADLDQYLGRSRVPAPESKKPRRPWLIRAALGFVAVMAMVAIAIQLGDDRGQLIIEPTDPQVAVAIASSGVTVEDREAGRTYQIKAGSQPVKPGEYSLVVTDGSGLQFEATQFRVLRKEKLVLRAWIEPKATVRQPLGNASKPSPTVAATEPKPIAIPASPLPEFPAGAPLGRRALVRKPAALKDVLSWTVEPRGHRDEVTAAAYRPDGRQVATVSRDATLRIWDATGLELLRVFVAPDALERVAWSPDGRTLAAAAGDGQIQLWDADSGRLLRSIQGKRGFPTALAWSPEPRWLAVAIDGQGVLIFDVVSGSTSLLIPAMGRVHALAWHPRGQQLATSEGSKRVAVYEADSGHLVQDWSPHTEPAFNLAWSPDGQHLASASRDKTVAILNPAEAKPVKMLASYASPVSTVAFSSNGELVLAGYESGGGELRAWATGAVNRAHAPSPGGVRSRLLATSPQLESQITAFDDGGVSRLALKNNAETIVPGRSVRSLEPTWNYSMPPIAWRPGSAMLAWGTPNMTGEFRATPALWNLGPGELLQSRPMDGGHKLIVALAWSPDGKVLASGGSDPVTKIWNPTLKNLHTLSSGGWVPAIAFSRDGRRLAIGTQGSLITLWNPETGAKEGELAGHKSNIAACQWSPDGTKLASGSYDGSIIVWDVKATRPLQTITMLDKDQPIGEVHALDWSADGRFVAGGGGDWVALWNPETGQRVRSLKSAGWNYCLAFSHDSERLAAGNSSGQCLVWNVASGEQVHELPHSGGVVGVTWSDHDKRVACSSHNRIHVWNTENGEKHFELVPLSMTDGLAISPDGHVRCTEAIQGELSYTIQTEQGQKLVPFAEFHARHLRPDQTDAMTLSPDL